MLKKILSMNVVIAGLMFVALASSACSSLPSISDPPQPLAGLVATPVPDATPTPAASSAPSTAPEASRNANKGGKNAGAIPEPLRRLGFEAGVIVKTTSSQITLKAGKSGQEQVQVDASTLIVVPGKMNASLTDLHIGDRALARIPQDNSNAAATLVVDLPAAYRPDNVMLGVVQSNTNGTITLKAKRGSETLSTDAATQVIRLNNGQPVLGNVSDLQTGSGVIVFGDSSADPIKAQTIFVLPQIGKGLGKDKKNSPQPQLTPGA